MGRLWMLLCVLFACGLARAGTPQELERVEVRVLSATPGQATIDHGSGDGLAVGDRVVFQPREGSPFEGTILALDVRSARVGLVDLAITAAVGTRGEVRVPASRFAPVAEAPPAQPTPQQDAPGHPPWPEPDTWQPGQPLLARIRPLRPEERPRSVHGRVYAIFDEVRSSEDDRADGFYRLGTRALVDNLTGRGDRLNLELEGNYRHTDVPDDQDESLARLRLDRLSYARGGDRFTPERVEVGRFLHFGVPEFGVLDGLEWSQRTSSGQRYGVSVGFMPEPDAEMKTGEDSQLSAFYRWVLDETEQTGASIGYQKSFHDFSADRDLFVGTLHVLPTDGWQFRTTAWVDLYTSSDAAKGAGVELTQLYTSYGRRWEDGSSLALVYTHLAFPEMERDEFLTVADTQLADDHNERLALSAFKQLGLDAHLRGGVGGWVDEDEDGFDGELAFGVQDWLIERGLFELTGFGTRGRYTTSLGGRVSLGAYTEGGRWTVDYELAQHHFDGFSDDNDDLPQHRLRLGGDWNGSDGWSVSAHLDAGLWDDENSLGLSIYLQRSF